MRDDFYISNYFIALIAGCQQKPNPGSLISLEGTLFSTNAINITNPIPTASAPATATPQGPSGLTLGAIVGAVVAGVVVLLTIAGCCIVWFGKRRRRQNLERTQALTSYNAGYGAGPLGGFGEPKWGMGMGMEQDTGIIHVPGGWSIGTDETPTTAGGYGSDKTFSPYTSQYTSPVSARDMLNPKQTWDASLSLPPNLATVGSPSSSTKDEAIEMEKLRDQRIEERRMQEQQLREAFMRDAAEMGFTVTPTTAPIIRMPSVAKEKKGKRGLEGF